MPFVQLDLLAIILLLTGSMSLVLRGIFVQLTSTVYVAEISKLSSKIVVRKTPDVKGQASLLAAAMLIIATAIIAAIITPLAIYLDSLY